MRTLERFFHRRKITDINLWLRSNEITSHSKLVAWCKNNEIFEPDDIYFSIPSIEAVKKKSVSTVTQKITEDTSEATWHTPAAERPRKTSKTKTSKTKRQTKK